MGQFFSFYLTKILIQELEKSPNYNYLKNNMFLPLNFPYNISEVLRPFFSKQQVLKGEHEVIAFAHIVYQKNKKFTLIIDETSSRKFVCRHFNYLVNNLIGTVLFVGKCCSQYGIFTIPQAEEILREIELSDFRVSKSILDAVRNGIKNNAL